MARSTVKRLLSLYSYKSRNLFVRDLVSTRFFHHCQPSRSLICNLQPPPIPKQLELPSNQFNQVRKFGFFTDLYRKWFPLSGNEKPSADSTEIVRDEAKPDKMSSFDSTEVVQNETKPKGKPSFDIAENVQNVTKPNEKPSFDSTEVVRSESRRNGVSNFGSADSFRNVTKPNTVEAEERTVLAEVVQNLTKPDEKPTNEVVQSESRQSGVPSFDSADFVQNVTKKNTVEDEERTVLDSVTEVVGTEKISNFAKIRNRDPVEIYKELKNTVEGDKLSLSDRDSLSKIFSCFCQSGWATKQALAVYIGSSFYPLAARQFCRFLKERCKNDLAKYLVSVGPGNKADRFLFPIFVEYCMEEFQDEIKRFREMVLSADMTKPHTWFPFARAMKRKIVYHCGPTNSGKTYNALQRFMEAKKGVYCSPLRLLAMEVFDRVNASGVYCSLITGQERKEFPFSNHTACTVEMVSSDELYDVAVIDEIQMMADPARGYAWTRAMLGLKADEIHLCGDPSVLNIVRKLCKDTGDELVEQHYERFKPLVVEAKTLLGDLKNVKSGDCIVAFSRREIFEVKLAIEKATNHKCCVIYGALPPETRRLQASLFNDQDNEYDVLVSSDAVGMGLNLNIRRVVFFNLSKYNGDKIVPVPASQVKQIAGRAGRRGSRYPDGLTTTLNLDDLDYLIECLKKPFDDVKKVGLFPFYEQVELFAGQVPDLNFPQLLEKFGANCRLDGSYFLCQHFHIKKIANMLERIKGLSLEDRFNFCFAPVNISDPKAMYHLLRFASSYSQKHPVNIAMGMPKGSARSDAELLDLETRHQVVSMYLWLSNHFEEESFPFVKKAETMATDLAQLLGESLSKVNWEPESRNAQKPIPQHEKEEGGYQRPTSLIKKKKEEKTGSAKKPKKVTA